MSDGYTPRKPRFCCLKVFIELILFAALTILIQPILPAFSQLDPGSALGSKIQQSNSDENRFDEKVHFEYPEASSEIRNYFNTKYAIGIISPLIACLAVLIMLQKGIVKAIRDRFERLPYLLSFLSTGSCFYGLIALVQLPLTFYSSFVVEHQYKLSSQSFASWTHDYFAHTAFGALIVPLLALVFLLIRKFPRHWVFQAWLLLSSVILFVTFVEPILVDPVFNKFRALEDGSLKTRIISLCRQSGIEHPSILVADKSKQTKKLNAYVTGLGSSNRIVLYDTLLTKASSDQVLAVLAHELGHYRLKHVVLGVSIAIIFLLPTLFLAGYCLKACIRYLPASWGVKAMSDPAIVAVIALAGFVLPLVISPLPASISRLLEAEADAYGIRVYGHALETAQAFKLLSQSNLSDPNPPPFIEFWFFTHPSIKHRIDYALSQIPRESNSRSRSN